MGFLVESRWPGIICFLIGAPILLSEVYRYLSNNEIDDDLRAALERRRAMLEKGAPASAKIDPDEARRVD